jgi:hypothetical protein
MSKLLDRIKEAVAQHSIDELSTDMLARYKKKAGDQASEADKKGDFKKGNKRFSGIMKATKKQFANDAKNESTEVLEAGPFTYGAKTPRKGSSAYEAMMKRKEQDKNYKPIEPKDNMCGNAKLTKNEEVESIDELSKETLKSYVKKATKDFGKAEKDAGKASTKYAALSDKIGLARERRVMAAQKGKGSGRIQSDAEVRLHGKQSQASKERQAAVYRGAKRIYGIDKATTRLNKEEVESIEELSKKTLGSYVKGAMRDARYKELHGGMEALSPSDPSKPLEKSRKFFSAAHKRQKGVARAVDRLTKEEIETIEELSKKTLGSYYNKASADSYEHSRKALDAFDKGDKEKDDYHFKKMNKREIGKMKSIARSPHTNESCVVGDSVMVQTSSGPRAGKVNDLIESKIGVNHGDGKGVFHYHSDHVSKVIEEATDDTLIEGVSWERWSKLNESVDKSNLGQWMVSKHQSGYQYGHRDGVDHIKVHGTGKDAALAGSNWAKEQGLEQVYVLESFIPKNVKNDIPFGAIVNSALTTVSK